jgi:ATP-dependent RNA helicase SUPV3L1/SUV3
MSGYRLAGARAIRIDMLERLADLLRTKDSRAGFEANPDMLSITGMTLEQFSDLMTGLGYAAEKGERVKVKAAPEKPAEAIVEAPVEAASEDAAAEPVADEAPVVEVKAEAEVAEVEAAPAADAAPVDMEVFYTFKWGGNRGANRGPRRQEGRAEGRQDNRQDGDAKGKGRPQGKGKPRRDGGKPNRDGGKGGNKPQSFSARPARKEKAIDPDNPFAAALMGLKDKT